jgi:hypothetical protein
LQALDDAAARHAYAPGRWTVKEVIGHIADTERVMAYRALRIARGDRTPLPGFEQDPYVAVAELNDRPLPELLAELAAVRAATVALFTGIPTAAWTRMGTASDAPCSVRALAYIIAGHELHHRALLHERYGVAERPLPAS